MSDENPWSPGMLDSGGAKGGHVLGDPAGLLGRITELVPLCEDPRIHQAVESGDPFRVYRALVWARLFKRLPEHRETLEMLVRRRRLFARPVKGSLFLGTVNGFGATLLGLAEDEPDGTRISLHCLVALFRVPVFPLGAYLVQPTGGNALRSSWRIFARVPMTLLQWLWSRVLALGVIAAVAVGAYQAFYASRHHDVTVVNGLNRPLQVSAGKTQRTVAAGSHLTLKLPVGSWTFRAVGEDGSEVDALSADVKSGSQALVWNIAGAAPVYTETITYSSKQAASSASKAPTPSVYCGQNWLNLAHVDFAFVSPPHEMSMPKSQDHISKLFLTVPPISADRQVSFCVSFLADEGRLPEALTFLEAQARLNGWKGPAAHAAAYFAILDNPVKGLPLVRRIRDADPTDAEVNREYQTAAALAGREAEALEEYRSLAIAHPDSAIAQYLALRVRNDPDKPADAERALARFPTDPNLLRLAVLARLSRSDWAGTLSAWHSLAELNTVEADALIEGPVTALVALGRRAEALQLLEKTFDRSDANARFVAARLYGRVALLEGQTDADRLVKKLEKDGPVPQLRLEAGLPEDGKDTSPSVLFLRAVPVDAASARQAGGGLKVTDINRMDEASWALVYGEAIRMGDKKAAESLARAPVLVGSPRELFERYVRGEAVRLDQLVLQLEVRAAAAFIRSRNASLDAKERNELLAQAKRDDWLQTNVSRAIPGWTRASTGH
jgi:tetratricopeptide (TPR) repeat protein